MDREQHLNIEVFDPLGPEEAERILTILGATDSATPIALDVRSVHDFEDHLLVQIAQALANRGGPGMFIGLPQHETRILRYVGAWPGAK